MHYKLEDYKDIQQIVKLALDARQGDRPTASQLGSRLYELTGKLTEALRLAFDEIILEALAFLKTEGYAREVSIISQIRQPDTIVYQITITHPSGESTLIKDLWSIQ